MGVEPIGKGKTRSNKPLTTPVPPMLVYLPLARPWIFLHAKNKTVTTITTGSKTGKIDVKLLCSELIVEVTIDKLSAAVIFLLYGFIFKVPPLGHDYFISYYSAERSRE